MHDLTTNEFTDEPLVHAVVQRLFQLAQEGDDRALSLLEQFRELCNQYLPGYSNGYRF